MKVLFVSGSLSNHLQNEIYNHYGLSVGFAIQKYYKLVEKGFEKNGINIDAISLVPLPQNNAPFIFHFFKSEKERNVYYRYVPYLRFPPIYYAYVFIYVLVFVFVWCLRNRKECVVFGDVLSPFICLAVSLSTRLAGANRVAWVTDMPGMNGTQCTHYDDMNFLGRLQIRSLKKYSAFIFLTQETNRELNPNNRPYIIMEGLVDPDVKPLGNLKKNETRDILYAGGLDESYGLGYLCEAFSNIMDEDVRFVIYGDGPYKSKIEGYAAADCRIDYRGTAPNHVIVEAERKAMVLVNPRFTGAEYTFYSFPSKNMEYMVSGTPILTTKLAGIPDDYEPYIYTFDEETVEGYERTLRNVLNKSEGELRAFGAAAQRYILDNKNATVQVKKVLKMVNTL